MSADQVDILWQAQQQHITDALHVITERRAVIEQAKGMLMFVYGIDADAAFEVLRKQSQNHNVKLRLIAEQILKDVVELSQTKVPARRLAFDGLMLTAHRRVAHSAARQGGRPIQNGMNSVSGCG
jgi:predicted butyrate kinase (DUF1464 family)